jgi:hypothetical protein
LIKNNASVAGHAASLAPSFLERMRQTARAISSRSSRLDSLEIAEEYMIQHGEEILELFDWTGLKVEFHPITLDRFKRLLIDTLSDSCD